MGSHYARNHVTWTFFIGGLLCNNKQAFNLGEEELIRNESLLLAARA